MATATGPVDRRAPHTIGEAPQPGQATPTNNSSCISTIFSSCVAEDICCCTSLKSLGDIIWSALSSCWSAIASVFASIFGSVQQPVDELDVLENFVKKWEALALRINQLGPTPLQKEEWKNEIAAFPETLRNKIKQGLIDYMRPFTPPHDDLNEVVEIALHQVVGQYVMLQMGLLIVPKCLPKITAFEDKWAVKAFELPISAELKAEWKQDLQALLNTGNVGIYIHDKYSLVNHDRLPAPNRSNYEEACLALMMDEVDYSCILKGIESWKKVHDIKLY